jgi:hypothetical protein
MSCVTKKVSPPSRDRGARRAPLPSLLKCLLHRVHAASPSLLFKACLHPRPRNLTVRAGRSTRRSRLGRTRSSTPSTHPADPLFLLRLTPTDPFWGTLHAELASNLHVRRRRTRLRMTRRTSSQMGTIPRRNRRTPGWTSQIRRRRATSGTLLIGCGFGGMTPLCSISMRPQRSGATSL